MSKTSATYKSLITISTDDKKSKSKVINNIDIISKNFKMNLNNNLFNLKEVTKINTKEKVEQEHYKKIDSIINQIENLLNNYINDMQEFYNIQYENILRYYEQKIRILYEEKFNLELKKRILEESNYNLLKKEKEYDLIRARTGIIIKNGKIIDNNRKENEILILKKENSILKDTIEKQKLDFLEKGKTIQQNNSQLNKKLCSKLNSKNNKNKRVVPHHSHPKSYPNFQQDFIAKINSTKSKNKSIIYPKSINNNSLNTENSIIHNKSQRKSKTIKNYVNIKIRKLSAKNIAKNQNNIIKKKINKKNKSFNIKDSNPDDKNRNFSECFNSRKVNLLLVKTVNNNENNSKKGIKYFKFLSPINGHIKNINSLIPKAKHPLNEIKYSNSFTLKKNVDNMNFQYNKLDSERIQNKNIKKILISKIYHNKKNANLIINKSKKDSNSKSKINCGTKINKSNNNSKGKKNNINIINYTSINNYINKQKIIRKNK